MSAPAPVIYRESLRIVAEQHVRMHAGGTLLSVAPGRDDPDRIDLWYTTYPTHPRQYHDRPVYVVGTGGSRPAGRFVGTAVMPGGLVWHVFEGLGALS